MPDWTQPAIGCLKQAQVRRYFSELLSGSAAPDVTVLVAEQSGSVAGMTEIVLTPDPPGHQILIPALHRAGPHGGARALPGPRHR